MSKLYMAVDVGTSFIKNGVYDIEGNCLANCSEPVKDHTLAPGVIIQHGEQIYESVFNLLKNTATQLGEKAKDICAISFTGQMAGSMGVDENWNDVTSWTFTLDSRYLPYSDNQRQTIGDKIYEISGTVAPILCSKYVWFKNEFPELHKKIKKYVLLNGYIIGKLSHIPVSEARIDYSLLTWTGLGDIENRCWSKQLCEQMDIDMDLLPIVCDCRTIGGYLAEDVAKQTGLPQGIPLVVGAGDKIAGCVGSAILNDGEMIFEAASYGAIDIKTKKSRLDLNEKSYDILADISGEGYYVHKYITGSGIGLNWFADNFFSKDENSFAAAEESAKDIKAGSNGLLACGLFGHSAIPYNSDISGAFVGATLSHSVGHFYHSLLESYAYDLALTMQNFALQYPEYKNDKIVLIGGGAKSNVWPQILADVTGYTFETLNRKDVALLGAALLGANAVDPSIDIKQLSEKLISTKDTYTPNMENHKIYLDFIQMYKDLIKTISPVCKKLDTYK